MGSDTSHSITPRKGKCYSDIYIPLGSKLCGYSMMIHVMSFNVGTCGYNYSCTIGKKHATCSHHEGYYGIFFTFSPLFPCYNYFRNALSLAMLDSLHKAISDKSDDPDLRVIVLRSSGPVFSAGHDLRELVCIIQQYFSFIIPLQCLHRRNISDIRTVS